MAVKFEGSLIIAVTGVWTGSWDRKCQSVSGMSSLWKRKKNWLSASKAVIKPEIKRIHLILEAGSNRGGLLLSVQVSHPFFLLLFFSQHTSSLLGLQLPTCFPKCHERATMIVSEAMRMPVCTFMTRDWERLGLDSDSLNTIYLESIEGRKSNEDKYSDSEEQMWVSVWGATEFLRAVFVSVKPPA